MESSESDGFWTGKKMIPYNTIVGWVSRVDGTPILIVQSESTGKMTNVYSTPQRLMSDEDKVKLRQHLDEQRKANQPPHLSRFLQQLSLMMPSEKSLVISDSYLHCDDLSLPFEFIHRYAYFGYYYLAFRKIIPPKYTMHHEWSQETHERLIIWVEVHKLCWSLERLKKKITQTPADDPDIKVVKDIVQLIEKKFTNFFNSTNKDKVALFIKEDIHKYQEWIDDGIRVTKNDRCWSVRNLERELQCYQ